MSHPSLALFIAVSLGAASAQPQSNPIVDGAKPAVPPAPQAVQEGVKPAAPPTPQTAKPDLSLEMRGDIFMARKMYREAIDTFRSGNPQDPVLLNKTGIAYHQMMQLENARKSYEQALRQKKDYVEAMNNLGTVYYAKKSYRRAIGWYARAL